jgi:hypothetical protein
MSGTLMLEREPATAIGFFDIEDFDDFVSDVVTMPATTSATFGVLHEVEPTLPDDDLSDAFGEWAEESLTLARDFFGITRSAWET